jgi:hypothetical protein
MTKLKDQWQLIKDILPQVEASKQALDRCNRTLSVAIYDVGTDNYIHLLDYLMEEVFSKWLLLEKVVMHVSTVCGAICEDEVAVCIALQDCDGWYDYEHFLTVKKMFTDEDDDANCLFNNECSQSEIADALEFIESHRIAIEHLMTGHKTIAFTRHLVTNERSYEVVES